MSDNIPIGSGGGSVHLKAAPVPFKQRESSVATAATESSFISPSDSLAGGNRSIDAYKINSGHKSSGSKMMSQSFGGDPSPFLSSMITSTPPAPGVAQRYSSASHSTISYSGYLYKRSNFPHRTVMALHNTNQIEDHDDFEFDYEHGPLHRPQHESPQQYTLSPDRHTYVDTANLPSLPNMPGAFATSSIDQASPRNSNTNTATATSYNINQHHYPEPFLVSDHQWPDFHSPLAEQFQQQQQQQQHDQSAPPISEASPSSMVTPTSVGKGKAKSEDEKNPFQLGLESAAAFFGIRLGEDGKAKHDAQQQNGETQRRDSNRNLDQRTEVKLISSPIHPKPSSSPIKIAGKNKAATVPLSVPSARRAIPIPRSSANTPPTPTQPAHDAYRKESFREADHRRHSAPNEPTPPSSEMMESSLSFGTHNSGGGNSNGMPQDFYDPKDGHLWRAKYCVLENGVLYFYRNANDGDSIEAAAERKRTHQEETSSPTPVIAAVGNRSNHAPVLLPPTSSNISRRRSSAKDLSKSPMIRPAAFHHLDSSGGGGSDSSGNPSNFHSIWEKRVFLDCIEQVRTAEKQFGKNSFELTAVVDDETHFDKLVLKAPNLAEMNEWIFQFHRSLASFMRNIMDVFGSTSSSGAFLDIHRPSNMLSPAHASHHTPLRMAGSLAHSPSEKQLERLMAMSPRFHPHLHGLGNTPIQPTLSHGHGRTSLRRRSNLKRTSSEGASVASSPDGADTDSPHHEFAFREPSPGLQGQPLSISPPCQFLVPPPTTGAASNISGVGTLRGSAMSLENHTRVPTQTPPPGSSEPELSAPPSEVPEMERPKPSTGKYIPPHLRNKQDDGSSAFKSKYVPPHLRHQQHISTGKYLPPQMKKDGSVTMSSIPPVGSAINPLGEHAQLAPCTPTRRSFPVAVAMEQQDSLDVVEHSSSDFVVGGCADPMLIQGSVLDQACVPRKACRVKKSSAEAFGSFGGAQMDQQGGDGSTEPQTSCLRWEIGAVSECGVREHNEDAFLISNDLLNAFGSGPFKDSFQRFWTKEAASHSPGLFAIFDGHCGNQAARFAVERLAHFIHEELLNSPIAQSPYCAASVETVLRAAITKLDDAFCTVCQEDGREWESGATALVAVLANEHLVIANVGDCRGVLGRSVQDSDSYDASKEWSKLEDIADEVRSSDRTHPSSHYSRDCYWKEVTNTHSPGSEKEKARIEKANGWITTDTEIPMAQLRRMDFLDEDVIAILKRCLHYPSTANAAAAMDSERSTKECKAAPQRILHISRMCGELAVSRALGDRDFKAKFNTLSSQENAQSGSHSPWWDCPLFLTYPDDHNRQFQGDLIINTPEFQRVRVGEDGVSDEFLLLACDGLWDVMDTDDAVRVVRDLLFGKKFTAKRAAARLAELAIHLGSSDNVTVIVVRLFSLKDERTLS